jgi:hypothetical protein
VVARAAVAPVHVPPQASEKIEISQAGMTLAPVSAANAVFA